MEVSINNKVYQEALLYAQQQGLSLPSVIENFSVLLVKAKKRSRRQFPILCLAYLAPFRRKNPPI